MKKILLAIVCMVSSLCGCSESDSDNGPKGDSISLSKDLISLDFEGGTDEIVVTSSGDWRMSGTSTWAHPSVTEGKSGDTVVFTIDPNATDRNLQSEFKLFTGSAVARLTVTCGEGSGPRHTERSLFPAHSSVPSIPMPQSRCFSPAASSR